MPDGPSVPLLSTILATRRALRHPRESKGQSAITRYPGNPERKSSIAAIRTPEHRPGGAAHARLGAAAGHPSMAPPQDELPLPPSRGATSTGTSRDCSNKSSDNGRESSPPPMRPSTGPVSHQSATSLRRADPSLLSPEDAFLPASPRRRASPFDGARGGPGNGNGSVNELRPPRRRRKEGVIRGRSRRRKPFKKLLWVKQSCAFSLPTFLFLPYLPPGCTELTDSSLVYQTPTTTPTSRPSSRSSSSTRAFSPTSSGPWSPTPPSSCSTSVPSSSSSSASSAYSRSA